VESDIYPIMTGYEAVLAHRSRPPFAYPAKQDGIVSRVNKKTGQIEVTYKDGTIEVFKTGDNISRNSGGGHSLRQHMVANGIEKGQKFKRGDVLAYNDEFFKPIPGTKQVAATLGITVNVACLEDDITLEDSSSISEATARRLAFHPIYERDVVISKTTTIHDIALPGTKVTSIDPLMIFDEADVPEGLTKTDDDELLEMLTNLNKSTPRAKHDGTVVRVKAFYTAARTTMSPSVRKAISAIDAVGEEEAKFAAKAKNKHVFPEQGPLMKSDRIGIVTLDDDTIVLRFYIEHLTPMGGGSKVIFGPSLKSVSAEVTADKIETEDGAIEIDGRTSFRGINNRIVFGVIITGTAARVMDKLQQDVIAMWDE